MSEQLRVYISPSTQPSNMCAFGDSEQNHCGQLAQKIATLLSARGVACKLRGSKSITSGANEANSWHADLYVPIHTNAYNGKVRGSRFGYYPGREDSRAKCLIFAKHMKTIYPLPANVKVGTYEFLEARVPRMPSVYCEVVFHDCEPDARFYHEYMDAIALAFANAVIECGHSGMIDPIPAPIPVPVPDPIPTPTPIPEVVLFKATVITAKPLSLNLWEKPERVHSLALIPRGTVIDVLKVGAWNKVQYKGLVGYVDPQYLAPVTGPEPVFKKYLAKVITVGELSLNLWGEPNKNHSLRKIPRGVTVEVLALGAFYKVQYEGSVGYVDPQYLQKV